MAQRTEILWHTDHPPQSGYMVEGNRGDHHICYGVRTREQAEAVCDEYHAQGYRHLRIYRLAVGAPTASAKAVGAPRLEGLLGG